MQTDLNIQDVQFNSLIHEGQYERLANFLSDLQTDVEPTDQTNLKNLTAIALQICMFCQQCQMEIEWHRKANREIHHRLKDLQRQLETLINLIIEYESEKETQHPAMSVSVTLLEDRMSWMDQEQPKLWQRIREIFHLKAKQSKSEQRMTKVVVNTSFPVAVEKDEFVAHLDNRSEKQPPQFTTDANMQVLSIPDQMDGNSPNVEEETENPANIPAPSSSDRTLKKAFTESCGKNGQCQDKPPSFMIYCLGSFRVYQDDQLVQEWPSSKGKSIFKYLIVQRNQPVPKEVLMELFWPEAHPDAARNNLNVSIYGLRQALRNICPDYSHILFHDESYLINPDMKIWIDMEEFTRRIQFGRQREIRGEIPSAVQEYQAAEALYQGEFLAEDRYEDWLIPQRQSLQTEYLKLLDCLSQYYIDQKDFAACLAMCTKILAVDPCREEAHRRLMHCYCCQGNPYLALRQYHMCEEALRDELDLSPSEKTESLHQSIRTGKQLSIISA
jgi:DNA-binding SARP family transcriptional activator